MGIIGRLKFSAMTVHTGLLQHLTSAKGFTMAGGTGHFDLIMTMTRAAG